MRYIVKTRKFPELLKAKSSVSQLLTLKTDSKIIGDIITFKLSIEPGAKFTGNCKMSESENNEAATFSKTKEPEKSPTNQEIKDYRILANTRAWHFR